MGGAEMVDKEPPPVSAPEEKRPSLSLEELEAKQGNIILDKIVRKIKKIYISAFHFKEWTDKKNI